jgi:hypothetical protein
VVDLALERFVQAELNLLKIDERKFSWDAEELVLNTK